MKLARVTKKGNRSFYIEFLMMTLVPLIVCGVVMIMACSQSVKDSMTAEAEDNLRNVAMSVIEAYDYTYPGDYDARLEEDEIKLYKGDTLISDKYDFIDVYSAKANASYSVSSGAGRMKIAAMLPAKFDKSKWSFTKTYTAVKMVKADQFRDFLVGKVKKI